MASPPPPARVPPPPAASVPMRAAPPMAPAQQQQGGSFMGQMASNVASGMAIGTGSALARSAIGSLFRGGGSSAPAQAPAQPACSEMQTTFVQCLQQNNNDMEMCRSFYDQLNACQAQYGQQ